MNESPKLSVKKLSVIGCGLIGGSFALALKAAGLVEYVVGYSPTQATLDKAKAMGVIDASAASPADSVVGADLVLVAVPVTHTEAVLRAIRDSLQPTTLVMDVGSTKRDAVDAARRVLRDRLANFVPAHPIAGKELAGVKHAEASLFRERHVLLTPISQTDSDLVKRADAIWSALGAHVRTMTPETHDAAFAAVSHLPHLLAFAYLNSMLGQPAGADYLELAGPGFRDFSRIAASDPEVWRDILWTNREEVLKQSMRFRGALDALEHVMRSGDQSSLLDLIRTASDGRTAWSMAHARSKTAKN